MTESQLFEAMGRRVFELDGMRREYATLLDLLGKVCEGQIAPGRVTVDREKQTWALVEAPPPPTLRVAAIPNGEGEK